MLDVFDIDYFSKCERNQFKFISKTPFIREIIFLCEIRMNFGPLSHINNGRGNKEINSSFICPYPISYQYLSPS